MLKNFRSWAKQFFSPRSAPPAQGPVERADPRLAYYAPGAPGRIFLEERYRRCLPFVAGKTVLDIPCGLGWGTSLLTGCAKLHGVDLSEEAVAFARANYSGPEFIAGDMTAIPFSAAAFEVIVCLEGYEHLTKSDQQVFLSEAARILDAGGVILINVPVEKSGNQFHLHEPSQEEFLADVARVFETVDHLNVTGPGGREIFWQGRKRWG